MLNKSLTNLQDTWNDGKSVSTRDKIAFCSAVGNIFATALLLGMAPEKLPVWYTGQMIYYMPLRYFSYHRRGYHYFIADLCYWVNLLVSHHGSYLIIAGVVLMDISVIEFLIDHNVLLGKWTSRMGYNRLAKFAGLSRIVFHSLF